MKFTITFICLLAATLMGYAEIALTIRGIPGSLRIIDTPLDNPEPDTLSYDDRGTNYMIGSVSDYYIFTRFTPPADFQLRSIYVGIRDDAGSALPCSVWVHAANGTRLGEELSSAAITVTEGVGMYDVTLPEPVNFAANENFFVVVGRSPGYLAGWSPIVDGSTSSNRSSFTLGDRVGGPWQVLPVDVRIRTGGSLASYGDLCAQECFNDLNHRGPSFFVLSGDTIVLKGLVTNLSDEDATPFTAAWMVTDDDGAVQYLDSISVNGLEAGSQSVLTAPAAFNPERSAGFTARFSIRYGADGDSSNNNCLLRMWNGTLPGWYGYNDLLMSGAGNHDIGWMSGVSFKPAQYPASVDSVVIGCGSSSTTEIRIYQNDIDDIPAGDPIWRQFIELNFGLHQFTITPPVEIDSGASFTVAFVYAENSTLAFDTEPPNAAAITGMGTTVWLHGPDGWQPDYSGNFLMRAFLDTVSRSPVTDRPSGYHLPERVELQQNFPNPFNPSTTIRYVLPQARRVRLDVFNTVGQRLVTLAEGLQPAGSHAAVWDARGVSSGVYFYRLQMDRATFTQQMLLLK